jgi:24-methylenesterol C-methyltransferase
LGKILAPFPPRSQVIRARFHNSRLGLEHLTEVVEGNFLAMPFKDGTFDGAYAIEATCHAPKLEDVYGEVRGLKCIL